MKKKFLLVLTLFSLLSSLHADEDKNVINFAYYLPSMNDISGKDMKISLDFWAKELGKAANMTLKNHFFKDINKLKKSVKEKKVDVVSASTLVFAREFKPNTFQNGFKAVAKDQHSNNRLLLLVPKNASIKSIKDLKNKKIARIQNHDIENLYLNTELQKISGQSAEQFFKKNIFVKQYSKAVLKLFFKKVDAALVTESAYNLAAEFNPQIKKRLKVISTKELELTSFALFRSDVEKEDIKRFKEAAFNIHKEERGKQILTVFKAHKIIESDIKVLKKVKKLYHNYLALKK